MSENKTLTRQKCENSLNAISNNLKKRNLTKGSGHNNNYFCEIIKDSDNNIIGKKEIKYLFKEK